LVQQKYADVEHYIHLPYSPNSVMAISQESSI